MSDELKPTSGKAMREMREQGMVLPFPSGEHYRVRTITAARLLRRGNLPNILLSFVIDGIYNGLNAKKIDDFLALKEQEESALEFLKSLQVVCEEMFIEPRIVAEPKEENEVTIDDIPLVDQGWAFDRAFRSAREVLPFRAESEPHVVSLPQDGDMSQAA